ncbi:MAG: tripartite tricarboxylate transporter substrate binding protein [Betaproteobacteria bacterium]|jgi:tripartite-type tricarboxylate transporter receptor subunit TctC|nr:tripartite tricarboxylate transporter substrate binding protein [Betaproteobacteria bacterium]MDH5342033.1 tripartite tricarboxylate transporter substrate binding protein [Betaproteobacteria bacterium]
MRQAKWMLMAGALLASSAAAAQNFPTKPVRIIVPFSAGGATDIVTRVVAQKLTDIWGQTIVVDNRAGAGGNIGADLAAKSPPDGYTIFMTSGSIVTANPHMYRKLSYDAAKDLVAVTNVASGPQAIVVNPSFAAKTVKDLIDMAKAKPESVTFGSAGIGTQTHLAGENFIASAGLTVTHIPYKGEAPAISDLLGGQIQFVTPNLSAAISHVRAKRLRALGVTSPTRAKQLPDVPAVAETLPGFENLGWFGFMVPTGTPAAIVAKIHKDTVAALKDPAIAKRFDDLGMAPVGNSSADFAKAIKEEGLRWAKVIKERKLQVN